MLSDILQNVTKQQLDLSQRLFMLALGRAFQVVFDTLPDKKKQQMEVLFQSANIEEKMKFIKTCLPAGRKHAKNFKKTFQKALETLETDLAQEIVDQARGS